LLTPTTFLSNVSYELGHMVFAEYRGINICMIYNLKICLHLLQQWTVVKHSSVVWRSPVIGQATDVLMSYTTP